MVNAYSYDIHIARYYITHKQAPPKNTREKSLMLCSLNQSTMDTFSATFLNRKTLKHTHTPLTPTHLHYSHTYLLTHLPTHTTLSHTVDVLRGGAEGGRTPPQTAQQVPCCAHVRSSWHRYSKLYVDQEIDIIIERSLRIRPNVFCGFADSHVAVCQQSQHIPAVSESPRVHESTIPPNTLGPLIQSSDQQST